MIQDETARCLQTSKKVAGSHRLLQVAPGWRWLCGHRAARIPRGNRGSHPPGAAPARWQAGRCQVANTGAAVDFCRCILCFIMPNKFWRIQSKLGNIRDMMLICVFWGEWLLVPCVRWFGSDMVYGRQNGGGLLRGRSVENGRMVEDWPSGFKEPKENHYFLLHCFFPIKHII